MPGSGMIGRQAAVLAPVLLYTRMLIGGWLMSSLAVE